MSTYYDEATHKITTAYSACMSDVKDRLRASTKSYFHVYEKLVDHGYERMSSLYVRFLDGTAETTLVHYHPDDVIVQFGLAVAKAERIAGELR